MLGFYNPVKAGCAIDSLLPGIKALPADSVKVRKMLEAGWGCRYEKTAEAMACLEDALEIAEHIGFYQLHGNLYMAIGVCYYYKQDYSRSLDAHFKGLPYAEKYHNEYITSSIYMNIGNIYNRQGNLALSKGFYMKALPYMERNARFDTQVNLLNNMGMIEGQMGRYDQAVRYLTKAVEVTRMHQMEYASANCLNNLGIAYTFRKEYDKAFNCISEALRISEKYGDSRGVANSSGDLANIYAERGNHQLAWKYYRDAITLAQKTNYTFLLSAIYEKMSDLAVKTSDHKLAYEYHKKFKQLNDSLYNEATSRQVAEMSAKYETEKKDQEIVSLRNENSLKASLAQRRAWITAICIVALIVFVILFILLQKNITEKKRANEALQEKNQLITAQKIEIENQKNELENYTAELEKENVLAQYETLKNQVNPHFLFNSLNVLASLIKKKPEQAYTFTKEFAKIYRVALTLKENLLINLSEEIDFVQSYIYLQKMRFGESLHVNVNIPSHYLSCFVPPFSLQLIVENAIKHNIVSEDRPLFIDVYCEDQVLIVRNNLQIRSDHNGSSTGIGSKNLTQRYSLISKEQPLFYTDAAYYYVKLPLITEE